MQGSFKGTFMFTTQWKEDLRPFLWMEKSIDVETTVGLTSENWSLSFENENMISETEKTSSIF